MSTTTPRLTFKPRMQHDALCAEGRITVWTDFAGGAKTDRPSSRRSTTSAVAKGCVKWIDRRGRSQPHPIQTVGQQSDRGFSKPRVLEVG